MYLVKSEVLDDLSIISDRHKKVRQHLHSSFTFKLKQLVLLTLSLITTEAIDDFWLTSDQGTE
jgi:hypothetical protein